MAVIKMQSTVQDNKDGVSVSGQQGRWHWGPGRRSCCGNVTGPNKWSQSTADLPAR